MEVQGKPENPENLQRIARQKQARKVAQDFEAMFIHQMFKAMRQTVPVASEENTDPARRIFTEMMDEEVARLGSTQGGLGLADLVYRQLVLQGEVSSKNDFTREIGQTSTVPQNHYGSSRKMDRVDASQLTSWVKEAAEKHGVDENLIRAVIHQESGGNRLAVSPVGAKGLMQLMDGTARDMGVTNPWDGRQNVMGGTRYLRAMLDRFEGDEKKALAAYNAGPSRVDRYGGIPPFAETINYVQSVQALRSRLQSRQEA